MKSLSEDEFLKWATANGLGLHRQYPQAKVLDFATGSESRFWQVPAKPELRPYFLAALIDLLGNWQTCYVWRHLGRWPSPSNVDPLGINDAVELQILKGLGLPLGTAAVAALGRDEREALVTLLFSTTVFGWSVGEDLYVVPDHARQVIRTDHHDVVHVDCAAAADLQHWVSRMAEEGFELPDEPPDPTFKPPKWMAGDHP